MTEPELVQLLTPQGVRLDHPVYGPLAADLGPAELRAMYRDMVLVRRFDTEATALQRQGELGLWVQSLGQEAAQIGSGRALRHQDWVFPSYREHGVLHTRDVDPLEILKLFRGIDHGGWDTVAHRTHLYTLVIGSHTLHATGYATGVQLDGDVATGDPDRDTAVIVYFGDGATAQGDTNESLVFASVAQAPVVFFCQNNQWAISEPMTLQSRIPLFERARGFGFPGVQVDGNDVLAVQAVTEWALERARNGEGPTFIEAFTYRMGAHTTADDPTKYRRDEETQEWAGRDPIKRLTAYLREQGTIDDAHLARLEEESRDFGSEIRSWVDQLRVRTMDELFDNVYADNTVELEAQRREYAEYNAGFEEAL